MSMFILVKTYLQKFFRYLVKLPNILVKVQRFITSVAFYTLGRFAQRSKDTEKELKDAYKANKRRSAISDLPTDVLRDGVSTPDTTDKKGS